MRKVIRIAVTGIACTALTIGLASMASARGGRPAPPPPVLCGCLCPDGSFTTTHAPDENSCASACEAACDNTM